MTAQRAHLSRHQAESAPQTVWNAFVDLVSSDPREPFTREQRAASLVYWYNSEVQNGGHLRYFSNRGVAEAADAVRALRELGAIGHADILRAALSSIPPGLDPSPVTLGEYVTISREDPYAAFDLAFHAVSPPIQSILEDYLASHLSAFITFDQSGA
jgi:hypothetical protein